MKITNRIISIAISTSLILITACEKSSNEPPKASFTVSTKIARIGDTIYFQNTSENGNTFEWDFGDGSGSIEENPSHIYTEMGSYTVQLEVTNSDGSDEASASLEITLWSTGTPMPTGRWIHASCVVDEKIYIIGGGSIFAKGALGTVEEYDPVTDTWTTKSEMPTPRQALTASVVNGKIYAIGGGESPSTINYNGTESYSTVEEYDPVTDTWTTKSPMPTARWSHCAGVVDNKIYIIGGSVSVPFTGITTMEVYDPATDTWTQEGTIPRPAINSGATQINGKIYIIGGEFEGNAQIVDEYDVLSETWTQKTNMPTERSYLSCSVLDEKIYAMGGFLFPSHEYMAIVEIYDPATDTWTEGTDLITARIGLSVSTVDGKIYAIGGLTDKYLPTSKRVEIYYE